MGQFLIVLRDSLEGKVKVKVKVKVFKKVVDCRDAGVNAPRQEIAPPREHASLDRLQ